MTTACRLRMCAGIVQLCTLFGAPAAFAQERAFEVRGAQNSVIRFTSEGRSVGSYRSGNEVRGYLQAEGLFVSFNGLDTAEAAAFAVNASGEAAGTYRDIWGGVHGFVWRAGQRVVIDVPGAMETAALGIADSGEVVGAYRSFDCRIHGFRWTPEAVTPIDADIFGATATIVTGIDSDGTLTGQYSDAAPVCTQFPISTALLKGGRAFVLRAGVFTSPEIAGAVESIALGFNSQKEIVGQYKDAAGAVKGFAVTGETVQTFDLAGNDSVRRLGSSVNWFAQTADQIR